MRTHQPGFALVVTALMGLLLLPTAHAQQQEQKEDLPSPKTLDELKTAMNDVVQKNHLPGAGVALVSNGEVLWCGGFGKADVAANREIACDTEFRVGSISKSFVALALLKLEEEGKVNLQARVQDLAPEVGVRNAWESTNPVRVVNLLEHSAGFDDMSFSEVYNTKDPADFPLLKVFQAHPGPQETRWPPSTRFSYSNPGFGVAGYLIEKISGQRFDAHIRENILAPIGIDAGDFRLTDANRGLLAQGYHSIQQPIPYKEIYLRPAGDMKASPGELAKLVQFFLRRGRAGETQLVKPETILRMEYPATVSSSRHGMRLGYGLANYTEVTGGVVTHGHDGGIDGFISTYRYMPEQNWGYVVLLNSDSSGKALNDLNRLALNFLSRNFAKAQPAVFSAPPADLEPLTGFYAARAPRSAQLAFLDDLFGGVRIRLEDGQLMRSSLFGKPEKLIPAGKNLFRGPQDPEATSVFFTDANGTMVYTSAEMEGTPYAERVGIWRPYSRLALLAVCAALMVSALLFAVIWSLLWLLGKMKDVKHMSVRVVPVLAILVLLAVVFSCLKAFGELGSVNLWSVIIFVGTILFALLSVCGLWLALRVPREEIRAGVRFHSLLVSSACVVLTLFLLSWHLIGLRLWAP